MATKQNTPKQASTAAKSLTVKVKAEKKLAKKPLQRKRSPGRQLTYTREVSDAVCRLMASGMTLREACRQEGMPPAPTVRGWVVDNVDGFAERYTRARKLLAEHWADDIVSIADDGSQDKYIDPQSGQERVDAEVIARSRLRVDTRKWLLGRIVPNVYGDKVDLNHGVQPENPLAKLFEQVAGTALKPASD